MKPYVIKKGDYLTKLAFELGFDKDTVWNDGKNAELREKRADPDTLRPGDVLFVPEKDPIKNKLSKEADHAFSAAIPTVKLKVALAIGDKKLANEKVVIKGLGEDKEATTDGDGNLELDPTLDVAEVKVELPGRKRSLKLKLAGMDPQEEPSGARMRLQNLGLLGKSFAKGKDAYVQHDKDALAAALKRLQAQSGLDETGGLDDATMKALKDLYGS